MSEKRLPKKTLFFYGLSEMPITVANVPLAAYIPNYYGADLGISLAVIGAVWMIARVFDAITDPLIGYLGDRTDTRWGRRRVWMVAAIPFLMMAVYKIFFPQLGVDGGYLLFWLVVFWLGWTMLFIPYYAWAAELSPEYNERTTIAAWRMFIGMIANVATKVLPVLALLLFAYGGTREVVEMIGWSLLVLIPITVTLTVLNVPEKKDYSSTRIPIVKGLKIMWSNGPFKRLVFAFFFNSLGTALSTAVVLFYIRGVTGEEEAGIIFLLCYYTANLCGIPFWAWFSKKIGKHIAWMIGLSFYIVMSPLYMFLGQGDFYWMLPITSTTGFAGASFYVMPNSMKADVIDLDTLNSGEDRAALFFAVWSFVSKIALSIGPFLGLSLLAFTGFDSTPGAINSPNQILGLKIIFSFACPVFFIITNLIAFGYPITEKRQLEIRKQLEDRKAGKETRAEV